jgi:Gamma tubulin complex component N-terminal
VNAEYRLDSASADALISVLTRFAQHGSAVRACRQFCKRYGSTATIQAFAAALTVKLQEFDTNIANLQSKDANFKSGTTSLLALKNMLLKDLKHFSQLKAIVTARLTSNILLTQLHELACQSHEIGLQSLHEFTLALFLPALETYLRPLHACMIHGDIDLSLYPDFFVKSEKRGKQLVFDLARDRTGVAAPQFMLPFVNRVLAASKTSSFVKEIGSIPDVEERDFISFLKDQGDVKVNPFVQSFENAMGSWIAEKYNVASKVLKEALHEDTHLWIELENIHGIYGMLSVQPMTQFTQALFHKVCPREGYLIIDGQTKRVAR